MIILGVDPGTLIAGYGVIERNGKTISLLDVGFVVTHNLISHYRPAAHVFQVYGRAKYTGAIGIKQRRVDDLGIGQLAFQIGNASLNEALTLLGGIVFGVLGKITMSAGFSDGGNHRRALHGFHFVQLGTQFSRAYDCQWNRAHFFPFLLCSFNRTCNPCKS